jgi:predicted nucleic acid-binding protein
MRSLSEVERNFDAVPIDKEVARSFAMLVADARSRGRKPKIMDAWIAATAVTYDLPLFTQDADFGQFPDVEVVQV